MPDSSSAAIALLQDIQGSTLGTGIVVFVAIVGLTAIYLWKVRPARQRTRAASEIADILAATGSAEVSSRIDRLTGKYANFAATRLLMAAERPRLAAHMDGLVRKERKDKLSAVFDAAQHACSQRIEALRASSPAIRADMQLASALAKLERHKALREAAWQQKHDTMGWWGKLNHEPLDLAPVDKMIADIAPARRRLKASGDVEKSNRFFDAMEARSRNRLTLSRGASLRSVPASHHEQFDASRIAQQSMLLGAMSVPVSVWSDIAQAQSVYDTLREVNGNYAEMTDAEIWITTLMLPSESLAGLASLTKGAYFEKLVEADTGGTLFEHFNHPDTDIVVDGTAFQIKATDSASYIGTVDDDIPVIATSEIADATRAIDGGYTNADMEQTVDLALGGTIVDVGDTAVDAILTGLGGLGLLATIKGVGHAADQFNKNCDPIIAIGEGVEIAVVGTAKALVDTAELGYKALNSRPIRFAGRLIVKACSAGVRAVDRKLEGK